jgi:hypothetical protein
MIVGRSVRKAIDDWEQSELESAMLHACNAVDGTAGKLYPTSKNKERFTRTLRENYGILGPMGTPGIDLIETRFPVTVKGPKFDCNYPWPSPGSSVALGSTHQHRGTRT